MQTIIATTDFSQPGNHAVHYAAALAQATKAPLVLFHHFTYPLPATDLPEVMPLYYVDEIAAGLQARLETMQKSLEEVHSGLVVKSVVRSLTLVSDLEELFTEEDAALVVMGRRGENAVLNALFGSVTARVLREGKMPVLVVPEEAAFQPFKKMLFTSDRERIPSYEVFAPLRDLAAAFDAYVEVLTLFDSDTIPELIPSNREGIAEINSLDALLDGVRHGYASENETTISAGILDEVTRTGADLVGMVSHHHSLLSNLFNRSATQQVATHLHVPLLALAEKGLS